jgi:hypothetical protein
MAGVLQMAADLLQRPARSRREGDWLAAGCMLPPDGRRHWSKFVGRKAGLTWRSAQGHERRFHDARDPVRSTFGPERLQRRSEPTLRAVKGHQVNSWVSPSQAPTVGSASADVLPHLTGKYFGGTAIGHFHMSSIRAWQKPTCCEHRLYQTTQLSQGYYPKFLCSPVKYQPIRASRCCLVEGVRGAERC